MGAMYGLNKEGSKRDLEARAGLRALREFVDDQLGGDANLLVSVFCMYFMQESMSLSEARFEAGVAAISDILRLSRAECQGRGVGRKS